jgi:flagellar assembly factor FliW
MYGNAGLSRAMEGDAIMLQATMESQSYLPVSERTGSEQIETRFGKVSISYDQPLFFEKGLLGIPERRYFDLLEFPVKKFAQFRLLQSLEDHALSFITMPLELNNSIIAEQDLLDTAADLDIPVQHLSLLLVVNIYREMHYVRMSVNARAPLFLDGRQRNVTQAVLRNNSYLVRHMLSEPVLPPAAPSA